MSYDDIAYEKILYENPEKGFQLRIVLNTFRDTEYLHIRKYYLSYDEGYVPSKEGISFPANISSIYALLDGVIEICAKEESIESIERHFKDRLSKLK